MRVVSPLHFTEHHRFTVYRDFSLGPLEYKMLTGVYQPMIGAVAAGLYSLLLQRLPADRSGYSDMEQQRKLFHGLDLEPNDKGRKTLIELFSRLEAAGLLESTQLENVQSEERFYEYRLFAPLRPADFFRTQHLTMLLRDKIGVHSLQSLHKELVEHQPEEAGDPYIIRKELSSPFYEIFSLSALAAEPELERIADDSQPGVNGEDRPLPMVRFRFDDIIRRFPKNSLNRCHVERLEHRDDVIARINYFSDRYGLTLKELCQLLDEDGVFTIKGDLLEEELERRAHAVYMQRHKHEEERNWSLIGQLDEAGRESAAAAEVPVGKSETDKAEESGFEVPDALKPRFDSRSYNKMLATEPYTKVLKLFVAENVSGPTLQLFSKLNIYYRIPDAVLNALIHHMRVCNLPWKEAYIEKMAASLQGERIVAFGQAVDYFRKEMEARAGRKERQPNASAGSTAPARTGARGAAGKQKPKLPVYQAPAIKLSAAEKEELESIVKYLEGDK